MPLSPIRFDADRPADFNKEMLKKRDLGECYTDAAYVHEAYIDCAVIADARIYCPIVGLGWVGVKF